MQLAGAPRLAQLRAGARGAIACRTYAKPNARRVRLTALTASSSNSAASSTTPPRTSAPGVDDATWLAFAEAVTGEWEGVTATFSPDGEPQQLPEQYVPGAFRDWGVELYDWQSQVSCNAGGGHLRYKVRRMMPTVGCEADAIAFTEEATGGGGRAALEEAAAPEDALALALLPDGSYLSAPPRLPAEGGASKLKLEAVFALPPDSAAGAAAAAAGSTKCVAGEAPPSGGGVRRSRLRVEHVLRRHWKTGAWGVESVELHRERWEGPFTGRQELAGCGGGQPGFAKTEAVKRGALTEGEWRAVGTPATAGGAAAVTATALSALGGGGDEGVLALLPLGAWSLVRVADDGSRVYAEAGVLVGDGERRVAASTYEGGALASLVLGAEEKKS